MRNLFLVILGIVLIAAVSCAQTASADTGDSGDDGSHHDMAAMDDTGDEAAEDHECLGVYACPMGCENKLYADSDAKCETCGMNVEMVEELYVCPDHPTEFSFDADTVCEETGHEYVEVETLYNCPMHPDEITADPDAQCSICGMNMVEIEVDPEACEHHGSEGESTGAAAPRCGGH